MRLSRSRITSTREHGPRPSRSASAQRTDRPPRIPPLHRTSRQVAIEAVAHLRNRALEQLGGPRVLANNVVGNPFDVPFRAGRQWSICETSSQLSVTTQFHDAGVEPFVAGVVVVVLGMDNLNTKMPGSLYEAFEPALHNTRCSHQTQTTLPRRSTISGAMFRVRHALSGSD